MIGKWDRFIKVTIVFMLALVSLGPTRINAQRLSNFTSDNAGDALKYDLRLKSNILPWLLTIPNIGAEVSFGEKWSAEMQVWFCPWKISDKFSVKTVAILPEARWWWKTNRKGSFINLHVSVAWYNVRAGDYRYQDRSRPLLGAGIGYGYRLEFNRHWGLEFEIGAGFANTKYERYYNVPNGALKDTRVSTYWGIDRASIAVSYYLCEI